MTAKERKCHFCLCGTGLGPGLSQLCAEIGGSHNHLKQYPFPSLYPPDSHFKNVLLKTVN